MKISADFDGGNIQTLSTNEINEINLNICEDSNSDEKQWFYFKAEGNIDEKYTYNICNAGDVSYPEAWETCKVVYSYDQKNWFRLPINFDGKKLSFNHQNKMESTYFALFAPYSHERHNELIKNAIAKENCSILDTCTTVNGNSVELLQVGNSNKENKQVWIIARQHPAETMAEWFAEGLINALLDKNNTTSTSLLTSTTFYIVPNMNPDGSIAGNLRTNGAGVDLNRSWLAPDISTSPESFFVLNKMKQTGVDLFLDIHGDEEILYAFIVGAEGNPSYTAKLAKQDEEFRFNFNQASDDFCIDDGYEKELPLQGNMNAASNQVGELFNCLSLTIEMPFTDNQYKPDEVFGWSPQRSIELGKAVLSPIHKFIISSISN